MTFAWPHLLWLLVLPAALLAWELARTRRLAGIVHPKILRAEAGLRQVSLVEDSRTPVTASRRRFLLCAGLALGIVALGRPQWGRVDEPVFDQSRDIVLALDLSRSMLTPDIRPNRLERAKLLIQSLLDRLHGERVGLVVFSGTAFLQSPVSADYEILREFLPSLGPDYLPEGGTNYRELIDTSMEAFGGGTAADRYLIILSDGEATDDDWRDRVPELTKRGIRVLGLGVGTASGGMIPDGSGGFMKDENGAVVMSKLEAGTLKELAQATHGVYRDASGWIDLPRVLAATVEQGRKGRFVEHNSIRLVERYQWALAQALACLLASFWFEFPVRPKAREIRLTAPGGRKAPARPAAAAAALLAGLLLFAGPSEAADPSADPAASLSKIVGRLSGQDQQTPLDWSELGQETVTWGQHLQSSGQAVPEGPVRDALAAVELGGRGDPKVADWAKLRSELEDLLKKPDEKKPDQQQQQNQQQQNQQGQQNPQKQGQQNQKDQQQNSQQPPQNGQKPPPSKAQDNEQEKSENGANGQQSPASEQNKTNPQQAFGNMGKPSPPPDKPGQEPMQTVGGPRAANTKDPAQTDPELAVPLEKLEQVKNQDSPAALFDLLRRSEPIPPPKNTGKNW
jgi:Ca-activated chloride channel family protein